MTLKKQITRRIAKLKFSSQHNFNQYLPAGWSPKPARIHITPTYRCNLKCTMCFQRDNNGTTRSTLHKNDELTPTQWKQIINNIVDFCPSVYWVGGEVMIYPQIVDLFAYSRSKKLETSFSTNGFGLADIADDLVKMNLECVVVSLDGLEDMHNRIRGHPHAFKWAIEGMEAVLKARKAKKVKRPLVVISFTITNKNAHQILDMYALAQTLGVNMIQFVGLMHLSQNTINSHHTVMQTEFGIIPGKIDVLHNRGVSDLNSTKLQKDIDYLLTNATYPKLQFWPEKLESNLIAHYSPDENFPLKSQQCCSIWQNFAVQPNGDVSLCPFMLEAVVGNVLEQDLSAIWNGEKFRQLRKRIRTELLPGCMRCTWSEYEKGIKRHARK